MDVISGDFYNFSDVIILFATQSSLISLDTLQSLQSESRAGTGEEKAFKLMVYQEFRFLDNLQHWVGKNKTLQYAQNYMNKKSKTFKCRGIGIATQIIKKE